MAKLPDDKSAPRSDVFVITDDHLAGICEGLAQAEHGEFVSDEDMAALWKKYDLIELTAEEEADLVEARAEMARGEFASDAEVEAVLTKYRR